MRKHAWYVLSQWKNTKMTPNQRWAALHLAASLVTLLILIGLAGFNVVHWALWIPIIIANLGVTFSAAILLRRFSNRRK